MYRKIFTPSEQNHNIPLTIPSTWYGQPIEVIVFPVYDIDTQINQEITVQERRKRCEELLRKYSIDLSNFKFNRDEANDY